MTSTARFNRSSRAARINAHQHLAALETIYLGLINQAARQAARELVAESRVTVTASGWQPPPEGFLLSTVALADRAVRKLRSLHARILRAQAAAPLTRAGIAWDITHPLSQNLLEQTAARTGERLAATVRPVLQKIVADAYTAGLPVRDAADLIRAQIGEAAKGQAQMLARTDLNSLSNGGSVMAATLVGVQTKTWLTAEDDLVRETHAEADGQEVPIDQPFNVGGELLDYPGDPGGSDAEVCNCRCTVIYSEGGADVETASAYRVPSAAMGYGNRMPGRGFAMAAPRAAAVRWEADLAFEGAATSDGRYILPGALTWRPLPLPLGAMFDTPHADMVTAAPVAGRIDTIERHPGADGVSVIRGAGEFDMAGEAGAETARMVGDETMRGVSIDLSVEDWCFRDPVTGELVEPDAMTPDQQEAAMGGELQYAVRAGTIMAATVCPTPAFADASISVLDANLVAAIGAAMVASLTARLSAGEKVTLT